MMGRFTNKVAIVTGAARGIGAAIVKRFVNEGAKVAILDVNLVGAKELAKQINSKSVMAIKCDVSNTLEVESAFHEVIEHFGKLDILVNNAGVIRDNLLFKMTEDDWDTVIDVHLKGAFLCSREAQKYMVSQRSGNIVNISSISALGNRGQVNYSSAKAGLQGMTRTMAIELGPFGINVNAIAPGFVETEMTKATAKRLGMTLEEFTNLLLKDLSIKRVGQPEDIASAVAFLSSDDASYITGQILYVAGRTTV
ncbi:SDR family NAD(P)-dependent oxidoreductase [Gottfriedia sp. NPDC056225]|uniref:SDR family NAD(P)-dependent oxidoreductase n=1 Tax=Gottfriedia sp. NPDC056225 TaxID=3345751 RepID=UPI001558874B|nr:3-oxoacyl-ACP reductase FabG [Arthrobacter citreus]